MGTKRTRREGKLSKQKCWVSLSFQEVAHPESQCFLQNLFLTWHFRSLFQCIHHENTPRLSASWSALEHRCSVPRTWRFGLCFPKGQSSAKRARQQCLMYHRPGHLSNSTHYMLETKLSLPSCVSFWWQLAIADIHDWTKFRIILNQMGLHSQNPIRTKWLAFHKRYALPPIDLGKTNLIENPTSTFRSPKHSYPSFSRKDYGA